MMTDDQVNEIIEKFKDWFRTKLIPSHIHNTKKLEKLSEFDINPFLLHYLANFLEGNSSPKSLAKALLYPRILGTSITTSFGTQMQSFVTEWFSETYGSTTPGIDIEFTDQIDGRHKYCQLKSGPNSLNKDDITTIKNHFRNIKNLARTNNMNLQITDMVFCMTYGEDRQLNSFVRQLKEDCVVYAGDEFWTHFTGRSDFYERLCQAAGAVANEIDLKGIVDEVVKNLAKDIEENLSDN